MSFFIKSNYFWDYVVKTFKLFSCIWCALSVVHLGFAQCGLSVLAVRLPFPSHFGFALATHRHTHTHTHRGNKPWQSQSQLTSEPNAFQNNKLSPHAQQTGQCFGRVVSQGQDTLQQGRAAGRGEEEESFFASLCKAKQQDGAGCGVERGKVGCASLAQLMDVHFSRAQSRVRLG